MAVDTEQKRKSVATVGTVWNPPTVVVDGSIDGADRQHIGWGYAGILVLDYLEPTGIASAEALGAVILGRIIVVLETMYIEQLNAETMYVEQIHKETLNAMYAEQARDENLQIG